MQTASMSAMNVVPRMKPSTASNARRPIASTRSPAPRGAMECASCAARSESRRKKKVSRSASTLVAMSEPTRLRPLSSPPAALAPNFSTSFLPLVARSSTFVLPVTPKWSTTH